MATITTTGVNLTDCTANATTTTTGTGLTFNTDGLIGTWPSVDWYAKTDGSVYFTANIAKPKEKEVAENVNTKLEAKNKTIFAKYYEDGYFKYQKDIMPDITNVIVYNNTVIVEFADKTKTKAILDKEDAFNLEQGISICITKKLLGKHGDGIYNKIMNRALKIKKLNEEAKIKQEEEKQREKARKEKAAAKKARRQAKRREAEIEIQKEAYVRAMKELRGYN